MPPYSSFPIAGSLLAIFPTALLMGLAFPIGLRLWARGGQDTAAPANPTSGRSEEERQARRDLLFAERRRRHRRFASSAGFFLLPILGSRAASSSCSARSRS